MVFSLFWRRPRYVASASPPIDGDEEAPSLSSNPDASSGFSHLPLGVPESLAFDRIINNDTCPPCTTRDFLDYLIYIEHAAENLQFFLWFRDYAKRFAELPPSEQELAPEWKAEEVDRELQASQALQGPKQHISADIMKVFDGTEFASANARFGRTNGNPFYTPPQSPVGDRVDQTSSPSSSNHTSSFKTSTEKWHHKQAAGAFESADLKWQPFTVQPFRDELARIIASYIADGGPRQLNLSAKERSSLLHALANTTHPSAFTTVVHTIEWTLRHQAHPNFVRWSITNGNKPRVIFACGLGLAGILAGIVTAIMITLSDVDRRWRVLSAAGFMFGVATLFAASKGMCVVLHGMHHRHLRPWELFIEDDKEHDQSEGSCKASSEDSRANSSETLYSSNSYEDEPWVKKYPERNIVRKVFDREVWVEEPALRQIQDTIFLQGLACAGFVTIISIVIFYPLPNGNYF